jgi:putative transposase
MQFSRFSNGLSYALLLVSRVSEVIGSGYRLSLAVRPCFGGGLMLRKKRHTETEIAAKLAEADALVAEGRTQNSIARALGISVMTFHRWRKARFQAQKSSSNGLNTAALVSIPRPSEPERHRRHAELRLENMRLRKLVTDLLLEKMRLEDEWHHNSRNLVSKKR